MADAQSGDVPVKPCCTKEGDCPEGLRCAGAELPDGGSCVAAPPPGMCWDASDCPVKHFCWGADPASCVMSSVSEPGECLPLPGGCCKADADCEAGYVCAKAPGTATGVCEMKAPEGKCWRDADCLGGQSCENVQVCPCNADCDVPDRAGTCFFLPGCCQTDVDCGEGDWTCVPGTEAGVCKPPVGPGTDHCWWNGDCGPTEACFGAAVCPCNADCDMADQTGTCKAAGCCLSDADCGVKRCVGGSEGVKGVCVEAPGAGRCWSTDDCNLGEACHGAAACPCGEECWGFVGPGVCQPEGVTCVAVPEAEIEEVCDAASIVIFDGTKCVATCMGCCGCGPWCDFTFQGFADCAAACLGGTCAVWDGACDDAMPEQPWWAFDGHECVEIDTCVCPACPGTFSTEEACKTTCSTAQLTIGVSTTGGYDGDGAYDWYLSGGAIEGHNPWSGVKNCSVQLSSMDMHALWEAAGKVEWDTIEKSYKSPENPYCCCDQFVWSMSAFFDPGPGAGDYLWTEWCDESEMGGKMPAGLLGLRDKLEKVGLAACGWSG
jgi:hypothetical protein